jgi:hypothetical protein
MATEGGGDVSYGSLDEHAGSAIPLEAGHAPEIISLESSSFASQVSDSFGKNELAADWLWPLIVVVAVIGLLLALPERRRKRGAEYC